MRKYRPKDNAQKQSYYTDRFRFPDRVPEEDVGGDEIFAKDAEKLKERFEIVKSFIQRGQLVIILKNPMDIRAVMQFFKDELDYCQLSEMSAMDYVATCGGFEMFYQMLSMSKRKRARVKYYIPNGDAIQSVTSVFKSADWAEREMYDMFGIMVNNHPNLKRLLLPEDWYDHPLKKSYPLQGDEAASWYEVDKIYGQEYRAVIGPEIRDAAFIDRHDTARYARVNHEVARDEAYKEEKTEIAYQEESRPLLIEKFDPKKAKTLPDKSR